MGAGASTSANEKGGVIDVGITKTKIISTMDKLFQQLLSSTNPINFKQALEATGKQTCSGILVILQPSIDKEFQQLAFEDPESKQIIKSIFKGYESIEDFSSTVLTKTLCKEITLFFLRLIILVGTCVISIRPNKAMTGLLGTLGSSFVEIPSSSQGIAKIKMSELSIGQLPSDTTEKIPDQKGESVKPIFKKLEDDGKDGNLRRIIQVVLEKEDPSIKKREGSYVVFVYESIEYVLDLKNLFLYKNETDYAKKVGVVSITSLLNDPPPKEVLKDASRDRPRDPQRDPSRDRPRDLQRDPQRDRPRDPRDRPIRGGSRKHRISSSRQTRKVYRVGGALDADEKVLKLKETGESLEEQYILFNRTDETCNKIDPKRISCPRSREDYSISTNTTPEMFITDLIKYYKSTFTGTESSKLILDKYGAKLEAVAGTGPSATGYSDLTVENKDTFAKLQNMLETGSVGKLEEGTCIAVYRAYLLASGIIKTSEGNQMKTYVCHDKWAKTSKVLNDIPFFSLLEQLYRDRFGKEMEPSTKNKYELFIDELVSKGTVGYISESAEQKKTFNNLQFKDITKNADLCKNKLGGLDTVTDTTTINDVIAEYGEISKELVTLIDKITKIIDKIINFSLFIREGRIKLSPVFVTDPRGAQVVLAEFTGTVRDLLEQHVLKVEEAYAKGFAAITSTNVGSLLEESSSSSNELAKRLV